MTVHVLVTTAPHSTNKDALSDHFFSKWHFTSILYSFQLGKRPGAPPPLLHLTLSHTAAMENSDPTVNEKYKVSLARRAGANLKAEIPTAMAFLCRLRIFRGRFVQSL